MYRGQIENKVQIGPVVQELWAAQWESLDFFPESVTRLLLTEF